jgi:hypothetical protein
MGKVSGVFKGRKHRHCSNKTQHRIIHIFFVELFGVGIA